MLLHIPSFILGLVVTLAVTLAVTRSASLPFAGAGLAVTLVVTFAVTRCILTSEKCQSWLLHHKYAYGGNQSNEKDNPHSKPKGHTIVLFPCLLSLYLWSIRVHKVVGVGYHLEYLVENGAGDCSEKVC